MGTVVTYNYRLAFSTITKAALLANSAYLIENFPMQSDQPYPGLGWTEPHRRLTKRPTLARYTQNGDLSFDGDGFYTFSLGWLYWTEGQMGYFLNAAYSEVNAYTTMTIPVTVQTYFVNAYVAFQALMKHPVYGEYDVEDGGYNNVVLNFYRGVIIT